MNHQRAFLAKIEQVLRAGPDALIILPGIPCAVIEERGLSLQVGDPLIIEKPNGECLVARIRGFEMVNRGQPPTHIQFMVDERYGEDDLVVGAKVYVRL